MGKSNTSSIIVLLALLVIGSARVYENEISFSKFRVHSGWVFLTKMTLDKGQSHITLQTKISGIPFASVQSVDFLIVSSDHWMEQVEKKCASQSDSIKLTQNLLTNGQVTSQDYILEVPQEKIYYFLFKDCRGLLVKQYSNNKLHIHTKLTIMNNNSHLSNDEDSWLIFPLILGIGAWLVFRNKQNNPWGDDFDWAKFLLLAAIVTNLSGLFWKGVSYIIYASNGHQYAILDIFYLGMHSLSETIVVCLICLIAYGWTINYLYGEDFDLYIPIMTMLGLMNIIVTILNKINDQDHDKYHMYDSVPGWLLVGFRCIIMVVFLVGIILTYNKSHIKKRSFIINFGILGAINILSLPMILLFTNHFIRKSNQKQFLFITVEVLKTLSTILLTYMITSKKSSYAKICYRNLTFLPQNQKFF